MAEWRFLRGWTDDELRDRLTHLYSLRRNFDDTETAGWRQQYSEAIVGRERPGAPEKEGAFARLRLALMNYDFSDPRIVTPYFEPRKPLEERRMLLEIRILGLRYLAGVVIAAVREEKTGRGDIFGFRYETLEGHLESGWEWFLIEKDRASGNLRFSIEARWREGEFPNFWTRIGFRLLARPMQKRWHRRAHRRMALLSRFGTPSQSEPHIQFKFH